MDTETKPKIIDMKKGLVEYCYLRFGKCTPKLLALARSIFKQKGKGVYRLRQAIDRYHNKLFSREDKAEQLKRKGAVHITKTETNLVKSDVDSDSFQNTTYPVILGLTPSTGSQCGCPDFIYRHVECKHIKATRLVAFDLGYEVEIPKIQYTVNMPVKYHITDQDISEI
jgi:hypothetical protein